MAKIEGKITLAGLKTSKSGVGDYDLTQSALHFTGSYGSPEVAGLGSINIEPNRSFWPHSLSQFSQRKRVPIIVAGVFSSQQGHLRANYRGRGDGAC